MCHRSWIHRSGISTGISALLSYVRSSLFHKVNGKSWMLPIWVQMCSYKNSPFRRKSEYLPRYQMANNEKHLTWKTKWLSYASFAAQSSSQNYIIWSLMKGHSIYFRTQTKNNIFPSPFWPIKYIILCSNPSSLNILKHENMKSIKTYFIQWFFF